MCLTLDGRTGGRTGGGRVAAWWAAGLLLMAAGGCQSVKEFQWQPAVQKEPTNYPIATDPAMEKRDWPASHAYWANGTVVAGPTRFPYTYDTVTGLGGYKSYTLDSLMFVYQAIRLPFTYFVDPPFKPKAYRGPVYLPTYTAMPRLGPEAGGIPRNTMGGSGVPNIGPIPRVDLPQGETPTPGPAAFEGARPTTQDASTQPSAPGLIVPATTPSPSPITPGPVLKPDGQ